MTTHPEADGQTFWDGRYRESERIWSGEPNVALVRETAGLTPGTALDLGCGEGADVVWLARQGWTVTGADISPVALGRAAEHAEEAGVAGRVDLQHHVLGESFPAGTYALVTASFLHSPDDSMPREEILRSAAAAVAPGGVLLVVGHAGLPDWEKQKLAEDDPHRRMNLPTPEQVLASLELPEGAWEILVSAEHERHQTRPDGTQGTRTDNALKVRRRQG